MRPPVLDQPNTHHTDSAQAPATTPKRTPSQSSHAGATHATARNHPISFFMMSGEHVERRSPAAPAILTTAASPQASSPLPRSQSASVAAATAAAASAYTSQHALKMPSMDMDSSTYGVQSLEEAMSVADEIDPLHNSRPVTPQDTRHTRSPSASSAASSPSTRSPAHPYPRPASVNTLSMPLTPVFAQSPALGAYGTDAVSTPRSTSLRSFRLEASDDDSDREDDAGSQAITSGSDEDDRADQGGVDDSAPQLVMPSVTMPQRRPFTEKGKQLGKLKILIAGAKGSGKSTLIKSIVQTCEDIVHVDPVEANPPAIETARRESARQHKQRTASGTANITEIYASTKPYPSWWSEIEESRLLRRRKSFNDTVLERNICFIDTPGFDGLPSTANNSDTVIRYVESLLHRSAAYTSMSNTELLNLMAGNGGVQVDVALFCMSRDPSEAELSVLKRLALLTNVIPIISKSDLLSGEDILAAKSTASRRLMASDAQPFLFGRSVASTVSDLDTEYPPYTVSSSLSTTDDTMDASLLMSPDYRPPLHTSDLKTLVSRIFDPSTASWLRHSAAKKFLAWRRTASCVPPSLSLNTLHPPHLQQPSINPSATTSSAYTASSVIASSLSPSAVIVSNNQQLSSPSHPTYTISRLADHTQREERLAQVRLARWASDLQRALRNERERFAALQDAERHRWLRARLGESVSPSYAGGADADTKGALVTARDGHASSVVNRWKHVGALDPQDPLGLLAWEGRVRWRLSKAATVVGGAGFVGAVVVWCVRYLEWHASLQRSVNAWGWWDQGWGAAGDGEGTGWVWGRVLA